MKPIVFSKHALARMRNRGALKDEVELAIRQGESAFASKGRLAFRKNFSFDSKWKGKHYEVKQVMPIITEENDRMHSSGYSLRFFISEAEVNHENSI